MTCKSARTILLVVMFSMLTAAAASAQNIVNADKIVSDLPDSYLILLPLVANPEAAQEEWLYHKTADGLHPDGNEQQLMWLMNRARANPTQEGAWLAATDEPEIAGGRNFFNVNTGLLQSEFASYDAAPPAAFDVRMYHAAEAHSIDLISRNAQDHDGQFQRIVDAGFNCWDGRGNVFSYARSSLNAHGAFNIDWGGSDGTGMQPGRGHRMAIMSVDGNYTNVGIAMVFEGDSDTKVGPLVTTENFCYASENAADHFNRFIVGSVWQDNNGNDRYDPGEGIGNVTVRPDKGQYYAVTANSGGYAIPIEDPGDYKLTYSGAINSVTSVTVDEVSILVDIQAPMTMGQHPDKPHENHDADFSTHTPPPGIKFPMRED